MVALNVELETNNDFERQTKDVALNAKLKKRMVALNTGLETTNGSER